MKKISALVFALLFAGALLAGGCMHGKDDVKIQDCCAWMKDAKIDVASLDNGAKVTVTAEKAEVVKAIQEHFAQMSKGGCKHGKEMKDCCAWMKDAKSDVVNEPKGVVLTVTTEKKDQVKAIQEHLAMMAKTGCMHGEEQGKECCAWMKEAKFDVTNLDKGAKMIVSSDKPEAVKAIQEHFTKMGKDCPMKDKMAWHKDARIDVANQEKGVVVTVTTEKKDDVKAIQEHFAAMGRGECCKGMKDGSGCKHKHGQGEMKKEGGCPHHKTGAAEAPKS